MATGVHGVTGEKAADGNTAIRKVNDTLQGSVVDILSQCVPELKNVPRDRAYERALDDISLLERCFAGFRANRDRFQAVLVDSAKVPVTDDKTMLSCGRSLEQVVAMIVRTAAKRYFRRKYCPKLADKPVAARLRAEPAKPGMFLRLLKGGGTEVTKPAPVPTRSRADELYDAVKDHLLHEWQVPFVPTYADMTPNLARALGPKLLEIRDGEQLRRIVDDPAEAAKLFDIPEEEAAQAGAAPADSSAGAPDQRARLSEVLNPDGRRLRLEAFNAALRRDDLRNQLKPGTKMAAMTEIMSGVGGLPAKLLVAELGLRMDQLALVILVAHETLGADVFGRIFGQPGSGEMVMRFTQKARLTKLGQQSTLAQVAAFTREALKPPAAAAG